MANDLSPIAELSDPPVPSPTVPAHAVSEPVQRLTQPQKAAVIVQLMLSEGVKVSLRKLPDEVQLALTEEIAVLRTVNQTTVEAIVEEFLGETKATGLRFPDDIEGALGLVGESLTNTAAAQLREQAGIDYDGDPWETVKAVEIPKLLAVLNRESPEVAAVVLAQLDVPVAAEVLGKLPGDQARRLAYGVSQISSISAETVRRIGVSLAEEFDNQPVETFDFGPATRVSEILNFSSSQTRDDVLAGLDEADRDFAQKVRKTIFTFGNIQDRLVAKDVPLVVKEIDHQDLVLALAVAEGPELESGEYLLANVSSRLADSLRGEVTEITDRSKEDGEAAMTKIVALIRQLEANGEIALRKLREDDFV